MDSARDKMRIDAEEEEEEDRLSVLPDDLVLKILSFVGLKDAIGTSILSSRWRFLWTSIPRLSFSTRDFSTMDKFSDFVTSVLARRDNQVQLSCFNLYLRGKEDGGQDVAQRIVNYAFSLNVQHLNIECLCGNNNDLFRDNPGFPLFLSSTKTLKHLTLSMAVGCDHIILASTTTGELSSLTTLHLDHITLYDGFFSKCPNLENLTLNRCRMKGGSVGFFFRICHPKLSDLTVEQTFFNAPKVIVATPQLKNLTLSQCHQEYQVSAPQLASLLFIGPASFALKTDGFDSLEKAQLSLHSLCLSDAPKIISILQKLHNVKVLLLTVEIIEILNHSLDLISRQPSLFANLKSLKILPKMMCMWKHKHMRVIMSTEVKNYLLRSSPQATLTEVLREHCCDRTAKGETAGFKAAFLRRSLSSRGNNNNKGEHH